MPRPKKYFEVMPARFLAGTFARIDAVLAPAEDRADFVRASVERELKRRKAAKPDTLARHLNPPTARERAVRGAGSAA
jgi:hypothetical protein